MDSNLAIYTVINTPESLAAVRLWENLAADGKSFYAPVLWAYETTSVIRKYCALKVISADEARTALIILNQIPIQLVADDFRLRQSALEWADRLQQRAAYDGFYLAVAEQINADFWSADQALVNNAQRQGASWVHWLGESRMPG